MTTRGILNRLSSAEVLNQYKDPTNLSAAVQRDDPDYLQEVLQRRRHIIGLDDLSKALLLAADRGASQCTSLLLEAGALPNHHDPLGWTPAVVAAKKGHAHIIKILADAGANVSRPTNRIKATALHWAASQGHSECVRVLLQHNARIEARTSYGRTPLMQAARSGFDNIVCHLIEQGAEVNGRDYQRGTALHLAAEEGNIKCMLELLMAGAEVDVRMKNGDTPIMRAAIRGQTEAMELLIERGCNLKLCGHQMTPLHWAAEGGHTECLKMLIEAGMDPDISTRDSFHGADFVVNAGMTPLMLAARNANVKAIQFLVKAGVEVNGTDGDGNTALLYAVRANDRGSILALLGAGAWVDGYRSESPHAARFSPLFYAIKENHRQSLRTLIRANCDLHAIATIKDGRNVGPLEYALSRERIACARMLISAGIGRFIIDLEVLQEGIVWLLGEDEALSEWIMEVLKEVPTLMQLSRLAVRRAMGQPLLPQTLHSLPLPPPLLAFLDFSELDEI